MLNFTIDRFTKRRQRPLEALGLLRQALASLRLDHEPAEGGPTAGLAAGLIAEADLLYDRLEAGPDAPVVVSVLGATGTGKSKIFNSLVGAPVSPSSFKRPHHSGTRAVRGRTTRRSA